MAIVYNDFYKEAEKLNKSAWNKAKVDSDNLYAAQVTSTNNTYDAQVGEANKAYESSYRENAIQKLINEQQVAESMANLGLTDSGLNRTQQTAVQLSYANNKANIDRQKQSQIDALELARTQSLDSIEQNRLASAASIDDQYTKLINETAMNNYNTAFKEETARLNKIEEETTKRLKQQEETETTKYKVRTAGGSGLDESSNEVYYFYDENGKKYTYPKGINPYTGKPITGGYTAQELKTFGVWNGYQPKCVKYNGQNYGKVEKYQTDKGTVQIEHQGHYKTVWQTTNGDLWIWDDEVGNYVRAYDDGKGNIAYEGY